MAEIAIFLVMSNDMSAVARGHSAVAAVSQGHGDGKARWLVCVGLRKRFELGDYSEVCWSKVWLSI